MKHKDSAIWVVTQNGQVVCGVGMEMDRNSAENKVENERRHGIRMEARPATAAELTPLPVDTETIDSYSDLYD